jgi:hypothetical protein
MKLLSIIDENRMTARSLLATAAVSAILAMILASSKRPDLHPATDCGTVWQGRTSTESGQSACQTKNR